MVNRQLALPCSTDIRVPDRVSDMAVLSGDAWALYFLHVSGEVKCVHFSFDGLTLYDVVAACSSGLTMRDNIVCVQWIGFPPTNIFLFCNVANNEFT